jgi:hypothetical protein
MRAVPQRSSRRKSLFTKRFGPLPHATRRSFRTETRMHGGKWYETLSFPPLGFSLCREASRALSAPTARGQSHCRNSRPVHVRHDSACQRTGETRPATNRPRPVSPPGVTRQGSPLIMHISSLMSTHILYLVVARAEYHYGLWSRPFASPASTIVQPLDSCPCPRDPVTVYPGGRQFLA